jgi:hypothetical protein
MKPTSTPQSLLQQMAAIERMEPGKLCELRRKGPNGPYYNLQRWENGANVSEYVPADQVPIVQENIEGYARFQGLVQEYVEVVSARSREERIGKVKKKQLPPTTSSPRKPKSKHS